MIPQDLQIGYCDAIRIAYHQFELGTLVNSRKDGSSWKFIPASGEDEATDTNTRHLRVMLGGYFIRGFQAETHEAAVAKVSERIEKWERGE